MDKPTYKSRAGDKLAFALSEFNLNVSGFVCADFGSNVGGFVDVLLQNNAQKVYAIETGYGVLDWGLRNDERVVVMERTNAMHVTLPELVDLVTIDTSWTKQEKILPNAINNLKSDGHIITLIKPHYEAPHLVRKGKLDEELAAKIALDVASSLESQVGLKLMGFAKSPVIGGKAGNIEFVALLKPLSS
jgi:23S rRNA (cytidine1920-2'-O)/16S rRNA (cytidine1409-2'-O)-methyltransferase